MVRIKLPHLKCLRCGHKWIPKKTEVRLCPKCKSPYWDKPRRVVAKRVKHVSGRSRDASRAAIKEGVSWTFKKYGKVIEKLGRE